ncbi:CRISPR-associated helicase Cas3', partial [Singulisphaera rosea]
MPAGHLLAKSSKANAPGRSLVGHTQDVVDAFEALFGKPEHPTAFAMRWARFFRLVDLRAFLINGRVAAETHDWGKANSEFQAMLLRKGTQLLRHEQISAVLLHQSNVWEWIGRNRRLDLPVILAAVVGHHLKVRGSEFGCPQGDTVVPLRVLWDDKDWQEYLATLIPGSSQAVPVVPKLWSYLPQPGMANLYDALKCVRDELEGLGEDLDDDEPRRRLLWAIRAALIVSDSAGSGLFREGKPLKPWIGEAFDEAKRLDGESVRRKVIEPRIEQIGERWAGWNGFQEACGNPKQVPARALLLAPCGSGKTLAAWRWIEARCAENPVSRVIFVYPTRGTATEGYRDYVSHAGPEEAALVHGTADLEIDDIHPDLDAEARIKEARLFALKQWPKQLFSATADQFLGFLQHGYGSTCLLPLLADSVLVLDEIHSYDRGMFSALLDLLRHFDIPVLCMTATLLKRRQDQLEIGRPDLGDHGLTLVNGLAFGGDSGQLQAIADHPRYRIRIASDSAEAERAVRLALEEGKRVLWVVNTVDRAREIARRLADDPAANQLTVGGIPLYCYHSRFRLDDRKSRHDQVINSFRGGHASRSPSLAITTQVCEMSLDLDAGLLVTEQAPASALVQRFG